MPENTDYTDQRNYIKFLKNKCIESIGGTPCDECNEPCSGECDDDCTCCPPGLIAVYDDNGKHIACLTPNDAEVFNKSTFKCADGFIKLYDKTQTDPLFVGCVSEDNFVSLNAALNP